MPVLGRFLFDAILQHSSVLKYAVMANPQAAPDMAPLRKWIHDLNNRVGVILATSELLQTESLSAQALDRRQTIEDKALEVREILQAISDHYFS
jgi:hypothetical protein